MIHASRERAHAGANRSESAASHRLPAFASSHAHHKERFRDPQPTTINEPLVTP